jgi:hypothetical protein
MGATISVYSLFKGIKGVRVDLVYFWRPSNDYSLRKGVSLSVQYCNLFWAIISVYFVSYDLKVDFVYYWRNQYNNSFSKGSWDGIPVFGAF